jgi:heat-inducible transcriptional repressor
VPTDLAYRVYVNGLMTRTPPTTAELDALRRELKDGHNAIEDLLQKAAQVLGVLTAELGVAVAPSFDNAKLERLELVHADSERILMVLLLKGGVARTIFVEVESEFPREALPSLAAVLNERLSGLKLREIRTTVRERLRDAHVRGDDSELLNIFIEEADHLFAVDQSAGSAVVLGSAQMLVEQPEFSSNEGMRTLLEITERPDVLKKALQRRHGLGVSVTIGEEHRDPKLRGFTLVTSRYESGGLSGVLGVMGPTRMPYEKVVALVENTSRLLSDFLK